MTDENSDPLVNKISGSKDGRAPSSMVQALNLTHRSSSTRSAIVEKLKSEQIPAFFEHVENREKEEHRHTKVVILFSFLGLITIISFFTFCVAFLKDTSLAKEIIIGLLSFIGGGGLGFGIGRRSPRD